LNGDLLALRDRAFVLTLVDTACESPKPARSNAAIWIGRKQRAVIIGKGDKQAVVRFSNRSIEALKIIYTLEPTWIQIHACRRLATIVCPS